MQNESHQVVRFLPVSEVGKAVPLILCVVGKGTWDLE